MSDSFKQIVVDLAAWSSKYPRGRIYNASGSTMDEELISLEGRAVALSEQSDDTMESKILQSGEAPVQQLKAEIAALVSEYSGIQMGLSFQEKFDLLMAKMRQLSAV
jgi:hypothetical protein